MSEEVIVCGFLESKDIDSYHYLQLWRLEITSFTRDGEMEPHLEFNILGGDFNFKDAYYGHFSNLIAKGSLNLERNAKRFKRKASVHKLTASLTTLITDNLIESIEKIQNICT